MKRSVKILWRTFLGGLLFVILLFVCAATGLFGKIPTIEELENPEADVASEIISSDGITMGKLYVENRSPVTYSQISKHVINALIATEDERFREHSGIDGQSAARAVFKLGTDGGGSTITQQLAKMILKQGGGNVFIRIRDKLKEWVVAVKLERNLTKEEIIALYLNKAPWPSDNVFGIRNAALTYFQKEPANLSINEAAVLVGMLKGPGYDAYRHPQRSLLRRNTVLNQMVKAGYLSTAEAEKMKAMALVTNYKAPGEKNDIAPYFKGSITPMLKDWCKKHNNPKTGEPYNLYRDGLKIYTTIDSRMQRFAEEAVQQHLPVMQRKLGALLKTSSSKMWKEHEKTLDDAMRQSERWKNMAEDETPEAEIRKSFFVKTRMKLLAYNAKNEIDTTLTPYDSIKYQKQLLQASFVCINPKSGEVKCWVGGINHKWFKFDHVTTARQVGSSFKPLLYTLAVKEENYKPDTYIPGGPLTLNKKTINGEGGTLANGLAFSKNIIAYRLMSVIGPERTVAFAKDCGIKADIPAFPSIALGAAEIPMLEMLKAYSMFANRGINATPYFITRIEDKNGNVLEEFKQENKQVIGESDAYTMVKMMEGVVKIGTGKSLNDYRIPVAMAGKTGTTNGAADGWFIGCTPELLAGSWVGCDDPFIKIYSNNDFQANRMALPTWGIFMKKVYASRNLGYGTVTQFIQPANYDNVPIFIDQNFDSVLLAGGADSTMIEPVNGDSTDYSVPPPPPPAEPAVPDTGKLMRRKPL
jgi:penicillin-binding protein 1A